MRIACRWAAIAGMVSLLLAAPAISATCNLGSSTWFDRRSATCNGAGRSDECQTARIYMLNRWRYGTGDYLLASTFTSLDLFRLSGTGVPEPVFESAPFVPWGETVPPSDLQRLQWDAAMLDDYPYGVAMFAHYGWVAFEVDNPSAPTGFTVRNAFRGTENPEEQGKYAGLFRAGGHVYAVGPYLDQNTPAIAISRFDDPTNMEFVSYVGLTEYYRVETAELGGSWYMFARDALDPVGGVYVVDLADPTLTEIVSVVGDGTAPVVDWQIDGASRQLFVLEGSLAGAPPRLRRYSLADPTVPVELPAITLANRSFAMVAATSDLVVVAQTVSAGANADPAPFMQAFSLADPDAPVEVAAGELEIGGFGSEEEDIGQVDGMTVLRAADGNYAIVRAAYSVGTATRIAGACVRGAQGSADLAVTGGSSAATCSGAATAPSKGIAAKGFPGSHFTVTNQSVDFVSATLEAVHAGSGGEDPLLAPTVLSTSSIEVPSTPASAPGEYHVTLRTFDGPDGTGNELASATRSVWLCPDPQAALAVEVGGTACGTACSALVGDALRLDASASQGSPADFVFVTVAGGRVTTVPSTSPQHTATLPVRGDNATGVAVRYPFAGTTDGSDCAAPMFSSLGLAANATYDDCRLGPTVATGEVTAAIAAFQAGIAIPAGAPVRPGVAIQLTWTGRVAPGMTPAFAWSLSPTGWTSSEASPVLAAGLPVGSYSVTLVVSTSGDSARATFAFSVAGDSFRFTASPPSVSVGQAVTLTLSDVSPGVFTGVRFNVGAPTCEGTEVTLTCPGSFCASGQSMVFSYGEAARGTVQIITAAATGATGDALDALGGAEVAVAPTEGTCTGACTVTIDAITPTIVPAGQRVGFEAIVSTQQGLLSDYTWSWGDGQSSSSAVPRASHRYSAGGTRLLSLAAHSTCGVTGRRSVTIAVEDSSMTLRYLPANPAVGEAVTFALSPPVLQRGDTLTVTFGDGGSATVVPRCDGLFGGCAGVYQVSHVYAQGGSFPVAATGTIGGVARTGVTQVDICDQGTPVAGFDVSPAGFGVGTAVLFTDTSTNAPTSWSWTFGDGGTAVLQSPTHVYKTEGVFTVTLTAATCRASSTRQTQVVVDNCRGAIVPVADFSWAPQGEAPGFPGQLQPFTGQVVTVTDRSSNAPSAWHWYDFSELAKDVSGSRSVNATWTRAGAKTVRLKAGNCVGFSGERAQTITVYEDTRPVTAEFTPPASMQTGVLATFTAAGGYSRGDPSSFVWSFSDGQQLVGQTVSHATSCRGRLEVTLTASRGTRSASVTRAVSVSGTLCAPAALVVPDAAHLPGLNGTFWRTDLRIFNPAASASEVTVIALPGGGTSLRLHPLQVPPHGTLLLDDVLQHFGAAGLVKAALQITFTGSSGEAPVVSARTYTVAESGGSFGQAIRGTPVRLGSLPRVQWITGLRDDGLGAGFRANLSLVNLRGAPAEGLRVTAYDAAGAEIGRNDALGLAAQGYFQGPVAQAGVPVSEVGAFTLKVELPDGVDVLPCAAVVDNGSGDPTMLCGVAPLSGPVVVPAVAHLPGELGTTWRSDLHISNPYEESRTWRLEVTPGQADASGAFRKVTIAPHASLVLADVVSWIYQHEQVASGVLRVIPADGVPGAPIAAVRTYNVGADGTYGQGAPALPATAGAGGGASATGEQKRLLLTGLSSEDYARSNLGFVNLGDTPIAFQAWFYDEAGRLLNGGGAAYPVWLAPGDWNQDKIENRFQAMGWVMPPGLAAISVEVRVTQGGPGFAYASVIDPITGDPVYVPGELAP